MPAGAWLVACCLLVVSAPSCCGARAKTDHTTAGGGPTCDRPTASLSVQIAETLVERGLNVSGTAVVDGSSGAAFTLRLDLMDAEGRVMDRSAIHTTAGAGEVKFELSSSWVLTMMATLRASGRFEDGAASPDCTVAPLNISIIPAPLDYDRR